MPSRDFFAFCTSLQPLELKALGELSQVRHIADRETIYRAGDAADALYIINRGVVEIVQKDSTAAGIYLSRGDIFGALELLTDTPRQQTAHAHESVSVQCFQRADFQEIVRRLPLFFQYLSEQLAHHLLQARDAAVSQSHCLELSGSLTNFDLVTIYQTIASSSQTGELSILNEQGELLAAFAFQRGQPCGGQFQHLVGEEAFGQLFQAENLRGTFLFTSGQPRICHAVEGSGIKRNADAMLIAALQARDELDELRAALPSTSAILQPERQPLNVVQLDGTSLVEETWTRASAKRVSLGSLYTQLHASELKLYRAVHELIAAGRLSLPGGEVVSQRVA